MLAHWWCYLTTGHDVLVVKEGCRIYSQCTHCGYSTTGWELEEKPKVRSPIHAWGRQDFKEARQEMVEAELDLTGGG